MKCTNISVTPANFAASLEKAKALFAKKGDREITLNFAGGAYNLSSRVEWNAAEFDGETRLRLVGGGKSRPVFTALHPVTAPFVPVAGKPYYVCQLAKETDGQYPNIRAFYANGKIADVSRTGEYRTRPGSNKEGAEYHLKQEDWGKDHKLYVPVAAVEEAGVENCRGAELHIRVEWEFKIYHIDYVDTADTVKDENGNEYVALQLRKSEAKEGNGGLTVCSRVFFICNTTSVLTTPGQFTYEREYGKLYYYPEKDIANYSFGFGADTNLFTFRNFDAITMQGLTFTGIEDDIYKSVGYYGAGQAGSWGRFAETFPHAGAVRIENIGEMDVCGCTFTDLPCDGIALFGALYNVTIRNSRFTNIGATAIRMGRTAAYTAENCIKNVRIENNFLYNIGFTYENCCSITLMKVQDGILNHNTVIRSSYSAFSLGWKWDRASWTYGAEVNLEHVEVAYNYICSFMTNMRDGGGIYTLGGNVEVRSHWAVMNSVHDNYVIEDALTCPENGFFGTLYHDGASSNWHTYNNVVIHNPRLDYPSGRIYLQAAWAGAFIGSTELQASWHILSENNYVTGCKNFGEIYRSQGYDPVKASDMLDYTRDNREKDTHMLASPKDLQKFPEAVRIMNYSGCDPKVGKKTKVTL